MEKERTQNPLYLSTRAAAGYLSEAEQGAPKMTDRYIIRPDPSGFSVIDMWTGERAIIASTPQSEMSKEDADHTAAMLNTRARQDDRAVAP
jgi:hypothetical protein